MIIGLTGGIASGKSTVSNMIIEHGLPVVDADLMAHLVVEPGEAAYDQIVTHFGRDILNDNNCINRTTLGEIIFNNKDERYVLNSIVHPEVRKKMREEMNRYLREGYQHVVLDIPLLFESRLTDWADRTLVVYVDPAVQLERLMSRNKLTKEEAMSRIASQMPLEEKKERADALINNNGTLESTKAQLITILKEWTDNSFLTK